jgi:hypothetical protein
MSSGSGEGSTVGDDEESEDGLEVVGLGVEDGVPAATGSGPDDSPKEFRDAPIRMPTTSTPISLARADQSVTRRI